MLKKLNFSKGGGLVPEGGYLMFTAFTVFMVHGCELNIAFFISVFLVSRAPEERDLITVPYLNPLVLRKELENMFENDGITTLQFPEVVQEKSIIFWNLVSDETITTIVMTLITKKKEIIPCCKCERRLTMNHKQLRMNFNVYSAGPSIHEAP